MKNIAGENMKIKRYNFKYLNYVSVQILHSINADIYLRWYFALNN